MDRDGEQCTGTMPCHDQATLTEATEHMHRDCERRPDHRDGGIMARAGASRVGKPRSAKLFKSRYDQLVFVLAHLELKRWFVPLAEFFPSSAWRTYRTETLPAKTKRNNENKQPKAQHMELRFLPVQPVHELHHSRSRDRKHPDERSRDGP